ncbi:MAG: RDD family protein [Pseudomonadota bacterium]
MSLPDPHMQSEFYAGVLGKRLMAWIVDTVIVTALTIAAALLTLGIGFFLFMLFFGVIGFVYRLVSLANGSATFGMRFTGVELRTAQGARLDASAAFLHTLGYTVSVAAAPLQLVSVVLMMISDRGQGLTDMVLGTAMVNRRAAAWMG